MSAAEPKPKQNQPKDEPEVQRGGRSTEPSAVPIDFSKLDLSIEKVEERISPGETNVFDK